MDGLSDAWRLPNHGSRKKMLYLGAQMELEAHLGHVSMLFDPYESIGVEIKSIGESQTPFLDLLLFFRCLKWNPRYRS